MRLFVDLWKDECGAILTTEAVLLGTMGVVGAGVGLTAAARTVNDELADIAYSLRSLDQSYSFPEVKGCRGWTAGSSFKQRPAEESVKELREKFDTDAKKAEDESRKAEEELKNQPAAPPEAGKALNVNPPEVQVEEVVIDDLDASA